MRLLADENCPRSLIAALRAEGHDVAWVREDARGSSDAEVLALARGQRRVLATFDKGFGELAFQRGLPASCGVILFRLEGPTPDSVTRRAVEALALRRSWSGIFATITDSQLRVRPLPARGGPAR